MERRMICASIFLITLQLMNYWSVKKQKTEGEKSSIVEFDLYEMMLQIIEEEGYMEDVLRMEKDYDKDFF